MERACFTLTLVPGTEEEYDRRHRHVWQELIAAIQAAGLRNFTGFRRGTDVVYYVECHPTRDEAVQRTLISSASRNHPDGRMFFLEEVSHVE